MTRITVQQYKFFTMIDDYPRIRRFWDIKKQSLDISELQQELNQLSCGEQHMARFFASVWLNESKSFPFDMLDAMHSIDSKSLNTIIKWLIEPYYP